MGSLPAAYRNGAGLRGGKKGAWGLRGLAPQKSARPLSLERGRARSYADAQAAGPSRSNPNPRLATKAMSSGARAVLPIP
jgi:hypothetical protein